MTIVGVGCAGLSLFAVYWAFRPIDAAAYRSAFLAVVLLLTFLVFRARGREKGVEHAEENPTVLDWALGALAVVCVGYAAVTADELRSEERRVGRAWGG